jgi:thymidylate synthase
VPRVRGVIIEAEHLDGLWRSVIDGLTHEGEETAPRGMKVRELRAVTLLLRSPAKNVLISSGRKLNYHFMVAEFLWMLFGHDDVATISAYNTQIAQFSDDGVTFFGAYGPRIKDQLATVIDRLQADPDTRQAVLELWQPKALRTSTKDVPCTLTWQFFIRDGALEMHVHMRSNDAWLGMPYDIFNFTQMQRLVASKLGIPCGCYVHHVGSMHLYEKHYAAATSVLADGPIAPEFVVSLPTPTYPMPREVDQILTGLAAKTLPLEVARALRGTLPAAWLEYATVLIHRFSKDPTDLFGVTREIIR